MCAPKECYGPAAVEAEDISGSSCLFAVHTESSPPFCWESPCICLVGFPQKIVGWRSACLDSSQAAELLCSCGMLWCPPSSGHHVFCPGTSCSIWYATATGDYTLHNAEWNTLRFGWYLRGEPRRIDKRSCQWEREGKMETFPAWSSAKAFQQVEIMFLRDGFSIQDS